MTTAPMTLESTTDADAVGIRSSALFGLRPYHEEAAVTGFDMVVKILQIGLDGV